MNEHERNPENSVDELLHKGMVVDDSQPVSLSELITTQSTQPDSKKS